VPELDALKADADDAVIQAQMARTYADGAHERLAGYRARLEYTIRAADAKRPGTSARERGATVARYTDGAAVVRLDTEA
jgi:hypothetical protein